MDRLLLVRHGETEWSRLHRHTGRTDLPLTPAGEEQARALRDVLAGFAPVRVLVSPLQRARRTAELAGLHGAGDHGVEDHGVEIDPDLAEWDYGDLEGRTTQEIEADHPDWSIWSDGAVGGESPQDVGRRTDGVLDRVRDDRREPGDVAVVAHGHLLRVLTARWLGLEPGAGRYFRLETATVSLLGFEHGRPVILRWNAPS